MGLHLWFAPCEVDFSLSSGTWTPSESHLPATLRGIQQSLSIELPAIS